MIRSRNEAYEDHSSFDKHQHKNKELKKFKLISEDEKEIMKRQRKGGVEEDEVIEHIYKRSHEKIVSWQ